MPVRNYVKGVAIALLGGALNTAYAQKAAPSAQKPPSWTKRLTQQALASGYEAKLPPHISMVLGLAKGEEGVPVKQLVSRAGEKVHTFNVSVADHRVVLFLNDEREHSAVAYMLAPGGKLRAAVSYQAGGEPREVPAAEARSGLAREARYWTDYTTSTLGPTPQAPTPGPAR